MPLVSRIRNTGTCQKNKVHDSIVYLRTSPEVSYRRVLERARTEEAVVLLPYLQQIHQLYEEWIDGLMASNKAEETDLPVRIFEINIRKTCITLN